MEWELQLTMQQLQGVKRRYSDLYPDLVESEASIYVRREGGREGGKEGGKEGGVPGGYRGDEVDVDHDEGAEGGREGGREEGMDR